MSLQTNPPICDIGGIKQRQFGANTFIMHKEEAIPVFISCDDNYAKHLAVVVASVCANSDSRFYFGILNKGLSEKSVQGIKHAAGANIVEFISVDASAFENFDVKLEHLSIETCFRYMIASIKPAIDKAVYLDCDIVVRGDLRALYETDISEFYAGVVEDFVRKSYVEALGLSRYFNSGAMLMNLAKIRRDGMVDKFFEKSAEFSGKLKFLDQDVLNIVLGGAVKYVDPKWNATAPMFRKKVKSQYTARQIKEAVYNPQIIHFTGPDKPWIIPFGFTAHPYTPLYYKYLALTDFTGEAASMKSGFNKRARFLWYLKRHPGFLFRPTFYKMRSLYRRNLNG